MFDQRSSAAKAFNALSEVLAVAQMAMSVKAMAVDYAKAGTGVMAGAAEMFAQSGWAGFAGVAANGKPWVFQ